MSPSSPFPGEEGNNFSLEGVPIGYTGVSGGGARETNGDSDSDGDVVRCGGIDDGSGDVGKEGGVLRSEGEDEGNNVVEGGVRWKKAVEGRLPEEDEVWLVACNFIFVFSFLVFRDFCDFCDFLLFTNVKLLRYISPFLLLTQFVLISCMVNVVEEHLYCLAVLV